jgi:hypothetical protein
MRHLRTSDGRHRRKPSCRFGTLGSGLLLMASAGLAQQSVRDVTDDTGALLWSPVVSGDHVEAPVTLGPASQSLKQLAPRVLGQRYPCAAMALMLFDPNESSRRTWEVHLNGMPTPGTVHMLAENQSPALVVTTLHEVSHPYDPDVTFRVALRITTESRAAEGALSSIVCALLDSTGATSSEAEPPLIFKWSPNGARLLGIYVRAK